MAQLPVLQDTLALQNLTALKLVKLDLQKAGAITQDQLTNLIWLVLLHQYLQEDLLFPVEGSRLGVVGWEEEGLIVEHSSDDYYFQEDAAASSCLILLVLPAGALVVSARIQCCCC
jgi:hypothetical protein